MVFNEKMFKALRQTMDGRKAGVRREWVAICDSEVLLSVVSASAIDRLP